MEDITKWSYQRQMFQPTVKYFEEFRHQEALEHFGDKDFKQGWVHYPENELYEKVKPFYNGRNELSLKTLRKHLKYISNVGKSKPYNEYVYSICLYQV